MRTLALVIAFLTACSVSAQTRKPINWKPCTDVTDKFKAEVEKWNSEHHDGFSIQLGCMYGGNPSRKVKPKQIVRLRPSEIEILHALRRSSHAAFTAVDKYETYLFRAHNVHKPETGEPCYHFAGIILDEDYITIDPNPIMATDDCEVQP